MVAKIEPSILLAHLKIVQEKLLTLMQPLSQHDLENSVESTKMLHPIATIKSEAIDWNCKQ